MEKYFDYKLNYDRMKLELCNSASISEREIHSYHEVLICEDVSVTLRTENGQTEIKGSRLFIIPRGKYHFFDLSGGKRFTRLKISIPDEMLVGVPVNLFSGEISVLHPTEQGTAFLTERLFELMKGEDSPTRSFHAYCAVMLLLCELSLSAKRSEGASYQDNNRVVLEIIEYISKNLAGDLSVSQLSREVNFSPSFLSHKFREEMGISLHRYILQKRMSHAKNLIDSGERPSKIYRECGYRDYSSFYKAYLRYFSMPPSEKEARDSSP